MRSRRRRTCSSLSELNDWIRSSYTPCSTSRSVCAAASCWLKSRLLALLTVGRVGDIDRRTTLIDRSEATAWTSRPCEEAATWSERLQFRSRASQRTDSMLAISSPCAHCSSDWIVAMCAWFCERSAKHLPCKRTLSDCTARARTSASSRCSSFGFESLAMACRLGGASADVSMRRTSLQSQPARLTRRTRSSARSSYAAA